MGSSNTPWPVFVAILVISITSYILIEGIMDRQRKKKKGGIQEAERQEKINQIYKDLPKFWTLTVILGLILGFVVIVFGIQYFWNTPGITPRAYLWDGFGVVMTGVIILLGSVMLRLLPRLRELDRRRSELDKTD